MPLERTGTWEGWQWKLTSSRDGDGEATDVALVHPDGGRRRCGFSGPVVYPDAAVNAYIGRQEGSPTVVLGRCVAARELRLYSDGKVLPFTCDVEADGVRYWLHLSKSASVGSLSVRGVTPDGAFEQPLHG